MIYEEDFINYSIICNYNKTKIKNFQFYMMQNKICNFKTTIF